MRQLNFATLIDYSFNRTIFILFKTFSWKKWFSLLLIAYLAGALGSGGNFRFNRSVDLQDGKQTVAPQPDFHSPDKTSNIDQLSGQYYQEDNIGKNEEEEEKESFVSESGPAEKILKSWPAWVFVLIGFGILCFTAFTILFMWLCSRFKFIWFNAIVNNVSYIANPFTKYSREADSLFKFFLVTFFVWIAELILIAGLIYHTLVSIGAFKEGFQWSLALIPQHFGFLAIIFFATTLLWAILMVCVDHFVITLMAMENCPFIPALKKFFEIYKENQKDFWLYLLILLGLGILMTIAVVILAFITILSLLLVAGILFGLPYLLIGMLLKLNWLYVIFVILTAIPFFVAAMLLFLSLGLPFAVFFRNFSLYFLSSLNCGYEPISLAEGSEEGG